MHFVAVSHFSKTCLIVFDLPVNYQWIVMTKPQGYKFQLCCHVSLWDSETGQFSAPSIGHFAPRNLFSFQQRTQRVDPMVRSIGSRRKTVTLDWLWKSFPLNMAFRFLITSCMHRLGHSAESCPFMPSLHWNKCLGGMRTDLASAGQRNKGNVILGWWVLIVSTKVAHIYDDPCDYNRPCN